MITIRAEFKHNTTDGIAHHDHKAETVQAAVEAAINFMKHFNYRFVGCVVIAEGGMNTTPRILAWLYKHGWLSDRRAIRRLELEAAWTAGYRAALRDQQKGWEGR